MPTKYRRGLLCLFALCLTGLLAGWGAAQDDPQVARMRKDITFLASDECEGRGVGTKGLDLAADYIAAQFKTSGLKPGGVNGTYFQPFPYATGAQLDGESTLVLQGPQGQKIALKQGVDFQVLGTSAAGKFEAPLVFVGYGTADPSSGYDDYAGIDVKGKAVLTLRRLPRWNSKEKPFGGAKKDTLAALESKHVRGGEHKAGAVILVNDASELPGDGLASFQTTRGLAAVGIPFVQIKRSVFDDILRSSAGLGLRETEKAIDSDLKPRSAALTGWSIKLDAKIKRQEVTVKNIIGVLEGSGPLANETVVVGAHYDHLGYGQAGSSRTKDPQKKEIHHGADDNASGTTTVMELTRRFAALKNRAGRRLVFIAFTAEEVGLIGSRHYVRTPMFPLKDTTAMFNVDMVGRLKDDPDGGKAKLLVEGSDTAKEFDSLVTKLNPGFDIVKKNSIGFISSDQYSFYAQKIPVIFFWTGTHNDYHRPSDTSDKINVAGMKRIADYSERVIDHLRTEAKRPEYVEIKLNLTMGFGGGPKFGFMPDYGYEGKGVLVSLVIKGSAAEKAGLKAGDVIIEIVDKAVPNVEVYNVMRAKLTAGVPIDIKVLREKKELKLKVTPK